MKTPKNVKIKDIKKKKNRKIKKNDITNTKSKKNVKKFLFKKLQHYKSIIQDTILYVQKYKLLNILDAGTINISIKNLESYYENILLIEKNLNESKTVDDSIINSVQQVNDMLSNNIRLYGTKNITDLVEIVFGSDYINQESKNETFNKDKFDLVKKYFHPTAYKIIEWKEKNIEKRKTKHLVRNKIVEDHNLADFSKTLDCFDLARTTNNFQSMVYGIKVIFQNKEEKKVLIISCVADDIMLKCIESKYVKTKYSNLKKNKPKEEEFLTEDFNRYLESLTLKELLIYNESELYHKYLGCISHNKIVKKKTISDLVREFLNDELYKQRKTLIYLLIKNNDPEFQYLAYLLYDLLSPEDKNSRDSYDQTLLFDSFPWSIKSFFRDAMKETIKYTKNLTNFDINKIPIEQQICLMKADDKVKEKAMLKYKEVKAKSEDGGSKARQYLEGLLKIPFGIYREEEILKISENTNIEFKDILSTLKKKHNIAKIPEKEKYSFIEIQNHLNYLNNEFIYVLKEKFLETMKNKFTKSKRIEITNYVCDINIILKKLNKKNKKLTQTGKKKKEIIKDLCKVLDMSMNDPELFCKLVEKFDKSKKNTLCIKNDCCKLFDKLNSVNYSFKEIHENLDKSIFGHTKAKRQIERIIGQWITGKQSGYCFGFEGPPGVGKTSLARKGLANCLKDKDSVSRPFSFIALGGSSNGSTLSGHSYTYVGSTWGRIVDILIESKCMNPIIFIDELDKVSRTENGKEIIGILTHLIDPTQNESFQDKYFSGIDIDMSKVLFIFSYNDVSLIDSILLDRIHRIKFDNLTIQDKLEIVNNYILPELTEKIWDGENHIEFTNEIIEFIIENYTREAGVRKLKELLFEIISEINLEILNKEKDCFSLPIKITKDMIVNKYFKEKYKKTDKNIPSEPKIGVMNGLWANSMGMGGIIPIETYFFPTSTFLDLKLTGMQGDVMKESMNVAKTLAWSLTPDERKSELLKNFEETKLQGIHIHCPEGAVPKDGPSAGTAITVAIFSLLNNKLINNKVAITGEINLQGCVTAIGGLDLKILGGIKAGVKKFLFPKENQKHYDLFLEKYKDKNVIPDDVKFKSIDNIKDVLNLVYV